MAQLSAQINPGRFRPPVSLSDLGTAASGLAELIGAVTPAYTVQGQPLPFDNTALVAAFAQQAGVHVVLPTYLLPATPSPLACESADASSSVADLWLGAALQASRVRTQAAQITGNSDADNARRKTLQTLLDSYTSATDPYLVVDKGPALLGRLLVAETLIKLATPAGARVIDLKLDAVDTESSTRTWFGSKKTNFASGVMAHYTLFNFTVDPSNAASLTFAKADLVNILVKVPDEDKFGSSVKPIGQINAPSSQPPQ